MGPGVWPDVFVERRTLMNVIKMQLPEDPVRFEDITVSNYTRWPVQVGEIVTILPDNSFDFCAWPVTGWRTDLWSHHHVS